MTDPTNGNGSNQYSVKDLLNIFVIPDLKEIKEEVKTKVGRAEFDKLELRLDKIESNALSADKVSGLIIAEMDEQSKASKELGISRSELRTGVVVAAATVCSLALAAHSAGVF